LLHLELPLLRIVPAERHDALPRQALVVLRFVVRRLLMLDEMVQPSLVAYALLLFHVQPTQLMLFVLRLVVLLRQHISVSVCRSSRSTDAA
jgi:hypothetical protein